MTVMTVTSNTTCCQGFMQVLAGMGQPCPFQKLPAAAAAADLLGQLLLLLLAAGCRAWPTRAA